MVVPMSRERTGGQCIHGITFGLHCDKCTIKKKVSQITVLTNKNNKLEESNKTLTNKNNKLEESNKTLQELIKKLEEAIIQLNIELQEKEEIIGDMFTPPTGNVESGKITKEDNIEWDKNVRNIIIGKCDTPEIKL